MIEVMKPRLAKSGRVATAFTPPTSSLPLVVAVGIRMSKWPAATAPSLVTAKIPNSDVYLSSFVLISSRTFGMAGKNRLS